MHLSLRKLHSEIQNPIAFRFINDDISLDVNALIGKSIQIEWLGEIHCISCGTKTKTSFAQGYCYPCFISLPETDACILNPELCQAHLGISRDMEWAEQNCLSEHIVYFSHTDKIKVGVTRKKNIPTRWIDQGALAAIPFCECPNRYTAGLIEVFFKKYFSDKSNWRKMIELSDYSEIEEKLKEAVSQAKELLPQEFKSMLIDNAEIQFLYYPSHEIIAPIKSIMLEKEVLSGTLTGIKGQYIIIDHSKVLNFRKYGGYDIEFRGI